MDACVFVFIGTIGTFLIVSIAWKITHKQEPVACPYRLAPSILTRRELTFWPKLVSQLQPHEILLAKVRLIDLLQPIHDADAMAKNRVVSKHVDFLICDAATLKPLRVIEVDDRSHDRADRQARDRFVDGTLKALGLEVTRLR